MRIEARSRKRMFGPKPWHEKLLGIPLLVMAGVIGLWAWWYTTRHDHTVPVLRTGGFAHLNPQENTSSDDESIPDASEVIGKTISRDFRMGKKYFVSLFAQEDNYKIYRVDATSGMTRRILLTDSADKIIDLKDVNVTDRALVSGNSDCFVDNKPQPGIYALAEVGYLSKPANVWKLEGGKLVEVNVPALRCGLFEHNAPVSEGSVAPLNPPVKNDSVRMQVPASDQKRQSRSREQVTVPDRKLKLQASKNAPLEPATHNFSPPEGSQVQDKQPIAEPQHEPTQPSAEQAGESIPKEKPNGFFNRLVDGIRNHGSSEGNCSDGEKAMHVNGC